MSESKNYIQSIHISYITRKIY